MSTTQSDGGASFPTVLGRSYTILKYSMYAILGLLFEPFTVDWSRIVFGKKVLTYNRFLPTCANLHAFTPLAAIVFPFSLSTQAVPPLRLPVFA